MNKKFLENMTNAKIEKSDNLTPHFDVEPINLQSQYAVEFSPKAIVSAEVKSEIEPLILFQSLSSPSNLQVKIYREMRAEIRKKYNKKDAFFMKRLMFYIFFNVESINLQPQYAVEFSPKAIVSAEVKSEIVKQVKIYRETQAKIRKRYNKKDAFSNFSLRFSIFMKRHMFYILFREFLFKKYNQKDAFFMECLVFYILFREFLFKK